jgi:peptidoglycan-associated lipoprotein
MKTSCLVSLFFVGAALTLGTAGCIHKPNTGITPLPDSNGSRTPPSRGPENVGPGPGTTLPPTPPPTTSVDTSNGIPFDSNANQWTKVIADHNEDKDTLKSDTVYFDFDSATIKKIEDKKLEHVAAYLKAHQADALRVEGNCDERGTEKYNLSLGDKRALAVREYLVTLGVDAHQVVTVSYGAAKPAAEGHSESAWSKNRRDDFVLLLPK